MKGQMGTRRREGPCLRQAKQPEKWENDGDRLKGTGTDGPAEFYRSVLQAKSIVLKIGLIPKIKT